MSDYLYKQNICKAVLLSGEVVFFDPFVSYMPLSDEDYGAGKGAEVVGKSFILTRFSVQPWEGGYMVTPYAEK